MFPEFKIMTAMVHSFGYISRVILMAAFKGSLQYNLILLFGIFGSTFADLINRGGKRGFRLLIVTSRATAIKTLKTDLAYVYQKKRRY